MLFAHTHRTSPAGRELAFVPSGSMPGADFRARAPHAEGHGLLAGKSGRAAELRIRSTVPESPRRFQTAE